MKYLYITCCILLLGALLPMPYGYYQFMRLAVCGTALYHIFKEYSHSENIALVSCGIALLYNPVFTVHFSREAWLPLNILTLIYFGYLILKIKDEK